MKFKQKLIIAAVAVILSQNVVATESDQIVNEKFLEALNMRDSGDLFSSIELLEKLIATQPAYKRAELELAVAYFRATLFEKAQAHAESVLNDPNTPDDVKDTISVFLAMLSDEKTAEAENRHSIEGSVGFGFGHDTNVNASPASDIVDINGLQFTLSNTSVAQTENYGFVSAQITHSYKMPGTLDIGSRPVKGIWNTTLAAYRKAYRDLGDFTLNVASLQTGLGLLSNTNWRAGVNFKYDHIELGGTRLGAFKGINANYTIVDGANQYTFVADVTDQAYDSDANKGLSGINKAIGANLTHQINPDLAISLGYNIARNDAREKNKEYFNRKMDIGLFYAARPETLLYSQAAYQTFDYNGVEPVYNTRRSDRQTSGTIGIIHTVQKGMLQDWKINSKITRYVNDSEISIYEYYRTDASVEFNKDF